MEQCPLSHQKLPMADPTAAAGYSFACDEEEPASFCLTCFLASLQHETSSLALPSFSDVQQGTLAILTGLTQQCPSDAENAHGDDDNTCNDNLHNNEALRGWVLDALDLSTAPVSEFADDGDIGLAQQNIGSVLADILVSLFQYLVHNSSEMDCEAAVVGRAVELSTTTKRTAVCANARDRRERGRTGCRAAFIELAVFLFSAWEVLLLSPSEAQPRGQTHTSGTQLNSLSSEVCAFSSPPEFEPCPVGAGNAWSQPHAPPDAFFSANLTQLPSARLTCNTDGVDARFSATHRAAMVHAVHQLVGRLVHALVQLRPPVAPAAVKGAASKDECVLHAHMCLTAASLLNTLASQAPFFKHALLVSAHVCALARVALPFVVDAWVSYPSTATRKRLRNFVSNDCSSGGDRGGVCVSWTGDANCLQDPSEAVYLLLRTLHNVLFENNNNEHPTTTTTVTAIVAQLNAARSVPAAMSPIFNATAVEGTPLLSTLHRLLKLSAARQQLASSHLTPLVLMVLRRLLTYASTHLSLTLQPSPFNDDVDATTPFQNITNTFDENCYKSEQNSQKDAACYSAQDDRLLLGEGSPTSPRGHITTCAASASVSLAPDFAVTLGALLLHPRAEVVELTCRVLLQLLDCPAVLDREAAMASHRATRAAARLVEPYLTNALLSALRGNKRKLCGQLVPLLVHVATILEEEEEETDERPRAAREGSAVAWDAEAERSRFSESYHIVRFAAGCDVQLFSQLICSAFFRRAIRSRTRLRQTHSATAAESVHGDHDSINDEDTTTAWEPWAQLAHELLDRSEVTDTCTAAGARVVELYPCLCFLHTLAQGMGDELHYIPSSSVARLMRSLAQRVEAITFVSGDGGVDCGDGAGVDNPLTKAVPLRQRLRAPTQLLLLRLVVLYLPYSGMELHHVGLLLLHDLVHAPQLLSEMNPDILADPIYGAWDTATRLLHPTDTTTTTATPAEGESRALLEVATHLLDAHNTLAQALRRVGNFACSEASGDADCVCKYVEEGNGRGGSRALVALHELCAPPPRSKVPGLFDVLLHLHVDAAALVEARAQFVRAMKGLAPLSSDSSSFLTSDVDDCGSTCYSEVVLDDSAWAGSVHELLTSGSLRHRVEAMLGLSDWYRHTTPLADGECVVSGLLRDTVKDFINSMQESVQRFCGAEAMSPDTARVPLSPEAALPEMGDGASLQVRDRQRETRIAGALRRLLCVVIVCCRWYGKVPTASNLSTTPEHSTLRCSAQTQRARAAAQQPFEEARVVADGIYRNGSSFLDAETQSGVAALVETFMLKVEEQLTLRQGLCRFLFGAALQHGVDVLRLLSALQHTGMCAGSGAGKGEGQLFSGLGAAIVLSAVLELAEASTTTAGVAEADVSRADAYLQFLHSVAAGHFLSSTFCVSGVEPVKGAAEIRVAAHVSCSTDAMRSDTHAGHLLLASLFRRARAGVTEAPSFTSTGVHSSYSMKKTQCNTTRVDGDQTRRSCMDCEGQGDADEDSEGSEGAEDTKATAMACLEYVLKEVQHQLNIQQRVCSRHQTTKQSKTPFEDTSILITEAAAATATTTSTVPDANSARDTAACTQHFVLCVLSHHLTSLMSAELRYSTAAATSSLRVTVADACTDVVLRLASLCLWRLQSTEGSACDGVLTQYTLRHIRLCLGLTYAETVAGYVKENDTTTSSAEIEAAVLSSTSPASPHGEESFLNCNEDDASQGKHHGTDTVCSLNKSMSDNVDAKLQEAEVSSAACDGGSPVRGLLRRTLRLLQLLYLLLHRSHRSSVAAVDREAVLVFANCAQRAAAASAATTSSSSCKSTKGYADVHVLAVVVQMCMHRLDRDAWARSAIRRSTRHGPSSPPWYDLINIAAFQEPPSHFVTSAAYRRRVWVLLAGVECVLRMATSSPSASFGTDKINLNSAQRTNGQQAFSARLPGLVHCADGTLSCCCCCCSQHKDDDDDNGDKSYAEWKVVSVLLDWCYGVLMPHASTALFMHQPSNCKGDDERGGGGGRKRAVNSAAATTRPDMTTGETAVVTVDEDASHVMTVAARLLYVLLHRCPSLLTTTRGLDAFLVASITGAAAVSDVDTPHVLAQGWLLATLVQALLLLPHWHVYARRIEVQVVRYLQRTEVTSALKWLQRASLNSPSAPKTSCSTKGLSSNSRDEISELANSDGASLTWAEVPDPELQLVVRTVVRVTHTYERAATRRGGLPADSGGPLLPSGATAILAATLTPGEDEAHSPRWWVPYTILTTYMKEESNIPLLFVADQLLPR